MALHAVGKTDDGRCFWLGGRQVALLRNSEAIGFRNELPFMIEDWLNGKQFEGMALWADLPYRTIAEQHERFPEIVVVLPNS